MQRLNKKGYSLIELTIVVGLISVLSITISGIVLTTIVNGTRIRNKIRIRQTGDYALGQMQTMIRNARSATCNNNVNSITLTNQDGGTTTFILENGYIASQSATTVYLTPQDTEVSYFILTCSPSENDPRIANITFTLGKPASSGEKVVEKPSETFTTSVDLRNKLY